MRTTSHPATRFVYVRSIVVPERFVETHKQRIDRELVELLGELRVALPGAQLLFTFLLTVPFTQRFEHISQTYRNEFFATFCTTACAMILLIAPSAHHRLSFRARDKEQLLLRSNRLAIAGFVFLAISMGGVSFFVTGLAIGESFAVPVAIGTLATIAAIWYAIPIARRLMRKDPEQTTDDDAA
jgi:hypothetical protein